MTDRTATVAMISNGTGVLAVVHQNGILVAAQPHDRSLTAISGAQQALALSNRLARSIWSALELAGHRRASRELRRVAAQWEHFNPELTKQPRDASHLQPNR